MNWLFSFSVSLGMIRSLSFRDLITSSETAFNIFPECSIFIVLGTWKAFRKSLQQVCNHSFDLHFTDFRLDFESRCRGVPGEVSGPLSGKNLSEVVNNIVWVRQLELKVFI